MGDENSLLTAGEARHLLRRTGFGAPRTQVALFTGRQRGSAVDELINFRTTRFKPLGSDIDRRLYSWVRYMIRTKRQLQEKLVLFWHDHFATSYVKVGDTRFMANQNLLFRKYCKGNFKDMVKAVNRDVAMIEFLDTVRNYDDVPNENYARELQELFTLGVKDLNGQSTYEQADIVQIARAFTGWSYNYNKAKAEFYYWDHDYLADYPERGPKVIYTTKGGFGASGQAFAVDETEEGEPEIDKVVDIIFDHTDSQGYNTVARHIAYKLISYFAHANPTTAFVNDVVANSGFAVPGVTQWSIAALLRAIFVDDRFYETAAPASSYDANTKKSVKWPTDYVVSTMRLLKMRLYGKYAIVRGGNWDSVHDHLEDMGQHLFEPPSVFGWDWELSWLSSASLLARYNFARDATAARYGGISSFRPQRGLVNLSLTDPGDIVDEVTDILGVQDQFTSTEREVLIDYLTDNGATPNLDLHDFDTRNIKLHGLFVLVLQSPASQLH